MQKLQPIVLVLDNIRSAHNVGAIWRTAEASGVRRLVLVGITPHPGIQHDSRLPHEIDRAEAAIAKTALGAEQNLQFDYYSDPAEAVAALKQQGYQLTVVEQSAQSVDLFSWQPTTPLALLVGNEVDGVSIVVQKLADHIVELPMSGRKESLNVAVTAGIVLYFANYKLQK